MTIEKFPHLLHGGDYNPDQWLRYPDILEQDIALMKNPVSIVYPLPFSPGHPLNRKRANTNSTGLKI